MLKKIGVAAALVLALLALVSPISAQTEPAVASPAAQTVAPAPALQLAPVVQTPAVSTAPSTDSLDWLLPAPTEKVFCECTTNSQCRSGACCPLPGRNCGLCC
jgi:hypothetical protein